MFLLRFVFRLLKVMNSETAPRSVGAAFALGAMLGLFPLGTLQAWVTIAVVLFLRVNITATIATFLVVRAAAPLYRDALHGLGTSLLENESLEGLWRSLTNHPATSLMDLGHTVTLGGTLTGLVLFVPVWMLGSLAVRAYRHKLEDRIVNSGPVRYLRSLKIVSLYRTLTSPFG